MHGIIPLTFTAGHLGHIQDKQGQGLGDVDGWVEYDKLQANSVLSFLTDANRGSGDHEFWGGGLNYKWMKNFDVAITFIYADRLSEDESYKLFILDFLSKV